MTHGSVKTLQHRWIDNIFFETKLSSPKYNIVIMGHDYVIVIKNRVILRYILYNKYKMNYLHII